ncbi:Putative uncharacterized transposon-derived protein F54H12.3 [Araneus ventricosus]|uniref:Uncharacterized transposon-derived protein F54H12.3 n=1 Tax=Araneus ventricosus TaxID=182803 RepID=A0A4Y2VE32_ARAVE|nr:Putative uncharacterized transposon-derived protein F54H12.3 [Araneus ventricosus]
MNEAYQDPKHVASFGGVDSLYRAGEGQVSKKAIQKWLQGVNAYTLHKPVRKKFQTNRVIVYAIDQQWQADLVDLISIKKFNKGFRYLLTCRDILSKHAWVVPLKRKRGVDIINAFKVIFKERHPQYLQTDQGTEFKNEKFQQFLKANKVKFFTTFNATKASVIERFNRTLKTKMFKYFTFKNTHNYIDVLDQLVYSYNHTYHSSIKRAPVEVNSENEQDVWLTLYGNMENVERKPCAFKEGDTVRISKAKLTFEKGYETNWTEELFTVSECVKRNPLVYRVKDLLGEDIQGTFYAQELQKVEKNSHFPIEKILRKRIKNNSSEYFVKFKGYPKKFNSWVASSDMISI